MWYKLKRKQATRKYDPIQLFLSFRVNYQKFGDFTITGKCFIFFIEVPMTLHNYTYSPLCVTKYALNIIYTSKLGIQYKMIFNTKPKCGENSKEGGEEMGEKEKGNCITYVSF